jgi:hypothetical protein
MNRSEKLEARYVILGAFLVFIAVVGIFALLSIGIMWSWSMFVTPVFGMRELAFQEAFGATVLLFVIRMILIPSLRLSK